MRLIISFVLVGFIVSCNNNPKKPDVSKIKIDISTRRFEKDLFSLDTNKITAQLDPLIAKYPAFGENFLYEILKFKPQWPQDTIASYVKSFISDYRPVFNASEKLFSNFSAYEQEIRTSLQYLKYYFPAYNPPHHIITYIGPLDGYGNILDEDAFYIGLHQHLGKDFPLYSESWLQETYPSYVTARFEPSYIVINSINNVIEDLFPEKKFEDKTLIVQMIEKGKRLYLLQTVLPDKEPYKLIGYTEKQLKDCYAHEGQIWDLFIQNNLLQSIDNSIIKNYVAEGPKTQELGEGAPGNIGSFVGWQIVKKYMSKHSEISPAQLMAADAEAIFQDARYKP